jgi:hypothetical protein
VMTLSLVSASTSLSSGTSAERVQRLLDMQVDVHRVDAVADSDVVPRRCGNRVVRQPPLRRRRAVSS